MFGNLRMTWKDLDVNTAVWGIFMPVTLQAAVNLGQDYSQNLRSIKNQPLKSVEQLFRTTGKLIKEQTEIKRLSTIYSMLCLRSIRTERVQAWERQIYMFLETCHL